MKINVPKLNELIEEKFRGNQTFFAETIGIDRHYLNQILNHKTSNDSPKVCNAIIKYCTNINLDYKEYIFLE